MKRKITSGGKAMTAIVLAGGRGRRMKADKARLAVGGRTLLEHVLDQLEPYFGEILVSVSRGQKAELADGSGSRARADKGGAAAGRRASFGVVVDEVPDLGPLGGILAGLKAAANEACAVVACDIPDIDVPLLRSLARAAGDADIAVPVGPSGHFEPLFAVYRKSAIPGIGELLQAGERSILPLFGRCRTAAVRFEDAGLLRNLNTRAEYQDYLKTLDRKRRS